MRSSVITIGNFDGVHVGHAALVRRAVALAEPLGARVVAMVFDPHPLARLKPEAAPSPLTTFEQRVGLLRAAGVDQVCRLDPRAGLLGLSPDEFVRRILLPLSPAWIVEGADFHFGRGRAGDVGVLAELGRAHGFRVEVVDPVQCVLTDRRVVTASSTLARALVAGGRERDAAVVLGQRRASPMDGRRVGIAPRRVGIAPLRPASDERT
jgi:riboflavin kinase / FMN adenylyltransferase